jgi:C4-dicarboxylate transporter DctM subunit
MIRKLYDNLEELLGSILLVAVCVVATIRVASRYAHHLGDNSFAHALSSASSWSVELSTYLFIWMVFIGASLALKKGEHFAVEVLVDKLPRRFAARIESLSLVLVALFSLLLVVYGGLQAIRAWHTVTPALEIPRSIPYAAVPFGGALMLLRSLQMLAGRRSADGEEAASS